MVNCITFNYFLVDDKLVAIPLCRIHFILFILDEEPEIGSKIFSGIPPKSTCFSKNHSAFSSFVVSEDLHLLFYLSSARYSWMVYLVGLNYGLK